MIGPGSDKNRHGLYCWHALHCWDGGDGGDRGGTMGKTGLRAETPFRIWLFMGLSRSIILNWLAGAGYWSWRGADRGYGGWQGLTIWLYEASEQKVRVDWMDGWMNGCSGYPLDCYDYKSTCGANGSPKPKKVFPFLKQILHLVLLQNMFV